MAKSEETKKDFGIFLAASNKQRKKIFGYHYQKDFAKDYDLSVETCRRWKNNPEFIETYVEKHRLGHMEEALAEAQERLIELATDEIDPDRKAIELLHKLAGREPARKSKKEITKTEKKEGIDEFDEGLAKWLGQVFKQAGLLKEEVSDEDIVEATSKLVN